MKKVILNYEGEQHVLTTNEPEEQESDDAAEEDAMREMFGNDADYLDEDIGGK